MWNLPEGCKVISRSQCRLYGFKRNFCVYSRNYRGTVESPGLCLGLTKVDDNNNNNNEEEEAEEDDLLKSGYCDGVLLKLPDYSSLQLIDAQEMVTGGNPIPVYNRYLSTVVHPNNDISKSLCFVANPEASTPKDQTLEETANIIAKRSGARGENQEYLDNTYKMLMEMELVDKDLEWLVSRVRAIKDKV